MTRTLRGRTSLLSVLVVLLAVPIVWKWKAAPVAAAPAIIESDSSAGNEPPPAPPVEVLVPLFRAGLDAEALAAAGISANHASTVALNAKALIQAAPNALANADLAYSSARSAADALQRKIQSGKATQDEIAGYPGLSALADTKKTARDAAVNSIFDAATHGLDPAAIARLQTIRTNRAAWSAPIEFLVVNRTEKEWVKLRDALANERISAKYEEPADQALAAQLATWRADSSVASAKAAVNSNLALVDAAILAAAK